MVGGGASAALGSPHCSAPLLAEWGPAVSLCLCSRLGMLEGTACKGWLGSVLALADQLPGRESVVCDWTGHCVLAPVALILLCRNKRSRGVL